jgi:hypothetical protein
MKNIVVKNLIAILILTIVSSAKAGELQGPARAAKDCFSSVFANTTLIDGINRAHAEYIVAEQTGLSTDLPSEKLNKSYELLPPQEVQKVSLAIKNCIETSFPLVDLRREFAKSVKDGFTGDAKVLGEFLRLVLVITIERVQASFALEQALDASLLEIAESPEAKAGQILSLDQPIFTPVLKQTEDLLKPWTVDASLLELLQADPDYADIYAWIVRKRN